MDEIYRMLGREHEADLEREAVKRRRGAEVRQRPGANPPSPHNRGLGSGMHPVLARVAAAWASLRA